MIHLDLLKREEEGEPIRIGSSGAGWMGSGFVAQVARVPGMSVVILADEDLVAARKAFMDTGLPGDLIVESDHAGEAADAIRLGKRVITADVTLAAKLDDVDVITDVTPSPAVGAEVAQSAIRQGKDVVLVNIEADVTVGRILKQLARDAGVLYTVSSGDEPGCLMELFDFVSSLGFEVIVIGKGKNNPLNPRATPDTVAEAALKADKDPYQVASYVDGSKTMFEMACAANATGCRPMRRGMTGPVANLENVSDIFALKEDGGITERPGSVDFVQGPEMAGGVFITVRVEDSRIREDLHYLKLGKGKYFTLFRPYHLWFLEAPISIARAHLYREQTLVQLDEPVAEVLTIAKRDLAAGERLDGFGGYTFYGIIDRIEAARELDALPLGLAPEATMTRAVDAGSVISWPDVSLPEEKTVCRLRRLQDGRA